MPETITWIAAHLIYVLNISEDGKRHVEEKVVLFRNSYEGEAEQSAIEYGKTACERNPSRFFAGIRKLIATYVEFRPEVTVEDGVELTHSYFEVAGDSELAELVRGGELLIKYVK